MVATSLEIELAQLVELAGLNHVALVRLGAHLAEGAVANHGLPCWTLLTGQRTELEDSEPANAVGFVSFFSVRLFGALLLLISLIYYGLSR